MIGGNTKAVIQIYDKSVKNAIGEVVNDWVSVESLTGWLDFTGGESKYKTYNAKIEESTHIFLCDYKNLKKLHLLLDTGGNKITDNSNIAIQTGSGANEADAVSVHNENARFLINGEKYDVVFIDDPMNLHKQLEVYLKFTGGDARG